MMIRICEQSFDPGQELKNFERRTQDAGAIVSFLGKVRSGAGVKKVKALMLDHFPKLTQESIKEIAASARARWNIDEPLIIHRVGRLAPGEPIVLVCVSAAHRRDAYEAADFLMDYLKTKAIFWKKEIRDDGECWIEPREADYVDAARWGRHGEEK